MFIEVKQKHVRKFGLVGLKLNLRRIRVFFVIFIFCNVFFFTINRYVVIFLQSSWAVE